MNSRLTLSSIILLCGFTTRVSTAVRFPSTGSIGKMHIISANGTERSTAITAVTSLAGPSGCTGCGFSCIELRNISIQSKERALVMLKASVVPLSSNMENVICPRITGVSNCACHSTCNLRFVIISALSIRTIRPSIGRITGATRLGGVIAARDSSIHFANRLAIRIIGRTGRCITFSDRNFILIRCSICRSFSALTMNSIVTVSAIIMLRGGSGAITALLLGGSVARGMHEISANTSLHRPISTTVTSVGSISTTGLRCIELAGMSLCTVSLNCSFRGCLISNISAVGIRETSSGLAFPSEVGITNFA